VRFGVSRITQDRRSNRCVPLFTQDTPGDKYITHAVVQTSRRDGEEEIAFKAAKGFTIADLLAPSLAKRLPLLTRN